MITNSAIIYAISHTIDGHSQDERIAIAHKAVEDRGANVADTLRGSEQELISYLQRIEAYDPVLVIYSLEEIKSSRLVRMLVKRCFSIVATSELDVDPTIPFVSPEITIHAVNNQARLQLSIRETERRQQDFFTDNEANQNKAEGADDYAKLVWNKVMEVTGGIRGIKLKEICERLDKAGVKGPKGGKMSHAQLTRYARRIGKEDELNKLRPEEYTREM